MAEETSEYSGTTDAGIGRFGEMSMDVQIAKASGISGIVECVTELPEPNKDLANKIYQLIAVQPPYVMGRFYKCALPESSLPGMWGDGTQEGSYSWKDVSEVREYSSSAYGESFRLDGNEVQFKWIDRYPVWAKRNAFIKTEIQLAYLDTAGAVKSVKTIFTEAVRNSYPDGAVVVVDKYTADGIAQGKITLRVRNTLVGLVTIYSLPKES